jgi:hypothetical protein
MLTGAEVMPRLVSLGRIGFVSTPYDWVPLAVIIALILVIFYLAYGKKGPARRRSASGHRAGEQTAHRSAERTAHPASHEPEHHGSHHGNPGHRVGSRRRPNRPLSGNSRNNPLYDLVIDM